MNYCYRGRRDERPWSSPVAGGFVDEFHGGGRITHLEDQCIVVLVLVEIHDDGVLGLVRVVEYEAPLGIEGAGSDDAGNVRPSDSHAMPPALRGVLVDPGTLDVRERNLQAAAECPQLVPPFHLEHETAALQRDVDHRCISGVSSLISNLYIDSQHTETMPTCADPLFSWPSSSLLRRPRRASKATMSREISSLCRVNHYPKYGCTTPRSELRAGMRVARFATRCSSFTAPAARGAAFSRRTSPESCSGRASCSIRPATSWCSRTTSDTAGRASRAMGFMRSFRTTTPTTRGT